MTFSKEVCVLSTSGDEADPRCLLADVLPSVAAPWGHYPAVQSSFLSPLSLGIPIYLSPKKENNILPGLAYVSIFLV